MEYLHVGLNHYLVLSSLIFGFGIFAVVRAANPLSTVAGSILMMSASVLNIIAFTKYKQLPIDSESAVVLILILFTAEFISSVIIVSKFMKRNSDPELQEGAGND